MHHFILLFSLLGFVTLQSVDHPSRVALDTNQSALLGPGSTTANYLVIDNQTGVDVYYEVGCTDGAVLGTHYLTIPDGTIISINVAGVKRETKCLAAASGTPTIDVMYATAGK